MAGKRPVEALSVAGEERYSASVFHPESAVAVELQFIFPSVAAGEMVNREGEHGRDESGFRHDEIVAALANLRPACEATSVNDWENDVARTLRGRRCSSPDVPLAIQNSHFAKNKTSRATSTPFDSAK